MSNQTQLEIQIRTTLDAAGIVATEEQVKKVTDALGDAQQAASKTDDSIEALVRQLRSAKDESESFGKSLKGLSNDDLLSVEERLREQIRTTQQAGGNIDELKRKLEETFNTRTTSQVDALGDSLKRATTGTGSLANAKGLLTTNANRAGQAIAGLNKAAGGLAQGGFGGLRNVVGGLTTTFRALGVSITRLAGPVGIAYGAVTGVIGLMKKAAEENEKAMAKMWEQAEAKAKLYKDTLEQLNKETEASQKRQAENLDALMGRYERLNAARDEGNGRMDRETERQKRLDLARANTPEEKAAVEARYAEADRGTRETRARQALDLEDTTTRDLREQQRDVRATFEGAQTRDADSRAVAREARLRAQEAKDALDAAQTAYDSAALAAESGFAGAAGEMRSAEAALKQAKLTFSQREQQSIEANAEAQAAAAALVEASRVADEKLAELDAKMEVVRKKADAAREELANISIDREIAQIEGARASAGGSTAAPSSSADPSSAFRSNSDSTAGKLYDAQQQRAGEVASEEARIKALEDQRFRMLNGNSRDAKALDSEIAARRSSLEAGNQSFAAQFEETARSIEADQRASAAALKSLAASSKAAGSEIVATAKDVSTANERTQRQLKNSREKSQP